MYVYRTNSQQCNEQYLLMSIKFNDLPFSELDFNAACSTSRPLTQKSVLAVVAYVSRKPSVTVAQ